MNFNSILRLASLTILPALFFAACTSGELRVLSPSQKPQIIEAEPSDEPAASVEQPFNDLLLSLYGESGLTEAAGILNGIKGEWTLGSFEITLPTIRMELEDIDRSLYGKTVIINDDFSVEFQGKTYTVGKLSFFSVYICIELHSDEGEWSPYSLTLIDDRMYFVAQQWMEERKEYAEWGMYEMEPSKATISLTVPEEQWLETNSAIEYIHPDLPEMEFFSCKYTIFAPENVTNIMEFNADYWYADILIRNNETGEALQKILGIAINESLSAGNITIEDMNFDGYKDIRFITSRGHNTYYDCWLYDTETSHYVKDSKLSGIGNITVDFENQYIFSPLKRHFEYYKYIDGILTIFRKTDLGVDVNGNDSDQLDITYE